MGKTIFTDSEKHRLLSTFLFISSEASKEGNQPVVDAIALAVNSLQTDEYTLASAMNIYILVNFFLPGSDLEKKAAALYQSLQPTAH